MFFNGVPVGSGYSGCGDGKNNPALQAVKSVGPIPAGRWRITGEPFDSPANGPFCLRLAPNHGTDTHGRSGFLIHGDSLSKPGTASRGCIVLPRSIRRAIWESVDTDLLVIADEPPPTIDDLAT
jgi:hypothetical protein